jgi:hypothetical protein
MADGGLDELGAVPLDATGKSAAVAVHGRQAGTPRHRAPSPPPASEPGRFLTEQTTAAALLHRLLHAGTSRWPLPPPPPAVVGG